MSKLGKKPALVIGAVIVLAILAYIVLVPKPTTYKFSETIGSAKLTDKIVLTGKKYKGTTTTTSTDFGKKTKSVDHYSGTYEITDNEIKFTGNPNGKTAQISNSKKTITFLNGEILKKVDK